MNGDQLGRLTRLFKLSSVVGGYLSNSLYPERRDFKSRILSKPLWKGVLKKYVSNKWAPLTDSTSLKATNTTIRTEFPQCCGCDFRSRANDDTWNVFGLDSTTSRKKDSRCFRNFGTLGVSEFPKFITSELLRHICANFYKSHFFNKS